MWFYLSDLLHTNQNLSKIAEQFLIQYWGNEKGTTFGTIGNKAMWKDNNNVPHLSFVISAAMKMFHFAAHPAILFISNKHKIKIRIIIEYKNKLYLIKT